MHSPDLLPSGRYELIDEAADKAVPVLLVSPKRKLVPESLGGWFITWQEATMTLAKDKRLNLTDHRVLLVLQARLDFDNWIRLSLSEIGSEIDVAKPHVSTSMKKLIEIGAVLTGPSVKNVRTYRLNPSIGWKGDIKAGAKQRREALRVIRGGKDDADPTVRDDPNQLPLL